MSNNDFLVLKNITKSFGKSTVIDNLDLTIKRGTMVTLLGPSGCGKTTVLRLVAGLENPTSGQIFIDGEDVTKSSIQNRDICIVFQSYALFPHMSIGDNVGYGLRMQGVGKEERAKRVKEALELVDLAGFEDRFVDQISGGQQQRVALARALVLKPKVLLFDEPLSNLDAKLRIQMRVEIKRIQKALGITTVFVTHDQEECFAISDRVAVMNKGVIEQYDTPENIYARPKTEFVARFIGFENFIPMKHKEGNTFLSEELTFTVTELPEPEATLGTIRPDDIEIVKEAKENCVSGKVQVRTFLGKSYQYEVETKLGKIVVNHDGADVYEINDELTVHLPANKIVLV